MKRNIALVFLFFLICGVILYSNILGSFFLSDDFHLIYSIKAKGPLGILCDSSWSFFRPLISLSFFIDYRLWGLNPIGYHFTNVLIHSLNAFLIFAIALLLKKEGSYSKKSIVAFFSGCLFLVMPCHTEAVSWITGRCDVVSTCLFLASLCSYLIYKEYNRPLYLALSLLFFSGGLFSKESTVILPFLILLFEAFYNQARGKNDRHGFLASLSYPTFLYFIALILYIPLRYLVLGKLVGGYGPQCHLNFDPLLILNNLFMYTMRAFLFPDPFAKMTFVLVSLGVTLIVILKIKGSLNEGRLLYLLIFSFAVSLIPIINLGQWTGDTQGERFIYLPSAFSSIIIIYLLDFLLVNRKYFISAALCLLLIYQFSLYDVNKNWNTAGKISKNIINSVKTLGKTDTLYIMNAPDNIRGAYIYRNGMREALYLFAPPNIFNDICICLYHNIITNKDTVDIIKMPEPNTYNVRLLNKRDFFHPVNMFDRPKAGCVIGNPRIINSLNNSCAFIVLKEPSREDKLIFYSQGAMERYNF
jgi:hypothetical protein